MDIAQQRKPVGVVIVEDDPGLRRRLAGIVAECADLNLLGVARGFAEGLAALQSLRPDVALIDLGLPDGNGIELIACCERELPKCDVLVLTVLADEASVTAAVDAGAHGYLLKDVSNEELVRDILSLRDGGSPVSPIIARHLLRRFQEQASPVDGKAPVVPAAKNTQRLTPREVAVLTLLSRGYSYAEIAEKMFISANTVGSHIKQIYRKLEVKSRGAAVFKAAQTNLVGPDPGES